MDCEVGQDEREADQTTKSKLSKARPSDRRKRSERPEPTANELMFEAWKKLYETRRERLL